MYSFNNKVSILVCVYLTGIYEDTGVDIKSSTHSLHYTLDDEYVGSFQPWNLQPDSESTECRMPTNPEMLAVENMKNTTNLLALFTYSGQYLADINKCLDTFSR